MIDLFLVSQSLISAIVSSDIGNIILSDHSPIFLHMLSFNWPDRLSKWRLNSSLLLDETFTELLVMNHKSIYIETHLPRAQSTEVAWEALKAFLRGQFNTLFKKESYAML